MPAVLQPGAVLGRWTIEAVIGSGAMGVVYLARHAVTGGQGALKIASYRDSGGEERRRRFEREFQLLAQLQHRHIVKILDADTIANGRHFYVTQYVGGGTLDDVLEREAPLDVAKTVVLLRGIASALDAAAGHRVVHGDVKPSNILVDDDGFPYLCDFGIAQADGRTALTTAGALGTWEYASPEHADRPRLCAASDQYSLACVAYECLTGRLPFHAEDPQGWIMAHLVEDPEPPSSLQRTLPSHVDVALLRALAKAPQERFPSCTAFLDILSGTVPIEPPPLPSPPAGTSDLAEALAILRERFGGVQAEDEAASTPPAPFPEPGQRWPYARPPHSYSVLPSAMDVFAQAAPVTGSLSAVVGRERARGVTSKLLKHRPTGGRVYVDEDGDAVSWSADASALVYLCRLAPHEWWPGLVTDPDAAPAMFDPSTIPITAPEAPSSGLNARTGSVPSLVRAGWNQSPRRPLKARFTQAGWTYEGFCYAPCPRDAHALAVFRKYRAPGSRWWALYCSTCRSVYAPGDLDQHGWGRSYAYP